MPVYIVTHKPTDLPRSDWYAPIAVGGRTLPGVELNDASGENIARLNREYCELTATYWAWKNARHATVGICHYRRYFNLLPTAMFTQAAVKAPWSQSLCDLLDSPAQAQTTEAALDEYDLVLPRPVYEAHSLTEAYQRSHDSVEWLVFLEELDRRYGAKAHSLRIERKFYPTNMVIARKPMFDRYAAELFDVIDKVFSRVGRKPDVEGARYQPGRYPGYLAERFTVAFVNAHRLKVFEGQTVFIDSQ